MAPVGDRRRLCYMDYLHIGRIGIAAMRLGHFMVNSRKVDGHHLLLFCLSGEGRVSVDGIDVTIRGATGVCIAPNETFSGEFSEDCTQLIFKIDTALMNAEIGRANSRIIPIFDLERIGIRPWVNFVNAMLSDRATLDLIRSTQQVAAAYERLCINLLVKGQGVDQMTRRAGAAPGVVRRAEAFIQRNYTDQLKLQDIALAANVPVRTLLQSFRQFRKVSPMRYLRDYRLERIREALLGNPHDSISNLALAVGFTHLGRFAHDYRTQFGEAPSETRQNARARGKPAASPASAKELTLFPSSAAGAHGARTFRHKKVVAGV
ncbi:AraC family transcriptional regulator [Rhizobium sp. 2MFCol3.1]|uniref:AraC family transcriptional regulator n=1 Tax=Rhizobium sp. 2MFCol3.1 TaxID=1246459 RepID=UPI001FD9F99F|nr:AraC family transcriptional regulator [Rhizobium sp. 2MFCol3.1]